MATQVTVMIAAYNAEAFIERALRSALDQSCAPDVIIVDDASTDGTVERVRSLIADEPRARLITQTVNQGPSAARNRALAAASTEWVTPLDADDAMERDRLERLLAIAEERGWDAVADDQYRLSNWSVGAERRRLWSDDDFGLLDLTLSRFVRENIMAYSGFGRELGYVKPLMRRAFLEENNLYYDPEMRLGEDYDLYCRILARGGRFGLTDPQGYLAYETPDSLSRNHSSHDLRQLVRSDQQLLAQKVISPDARRWVREHMRFNQKKHAWVKLREARREQDLLKAVSCFVAPPSIIADLCRRIAWHIRTKGLSTARR